MVENLAGRAFRSAPCFPEVGLGSPRCDGWFLQSLMKWWFLFKPNKRR